MLTSHLDPIVAVATAPGRGAVGIVRVSAASAVFDAYVHALLGKNLQPRVATYGAFPSGDGGAIDHGLAIAFVAPHSYTGESVLELQAHGGPAVLQLLVQRCLEVAQHTTDGAALLPNLRLAQPGEFTQRAFLNGKLDLAQAEAVADLIDASTEQAVRSAARSLSGAFSNEVAQLRELLVKLRMLVEATLDFPEEEIDFLQQADASGQLARLQAQLQRVMHQTHQGVLLREGISVVIAGQPNAGKSSLLNALAGAELAIVTPIAGTTRDVVQQIIQINGVPLHILDTAGLRDSSDAVEQIGIAKAWHEIEKADAVLFVYDASLANDLPTQAANAALRARLPSGVPVLSVWNKSDIATQGKAPVALSGEPTQVWLSAKTGDGLEQLRATLLQWAGWDTPTEGLYMARKRHVVALQNVAAHLQAASVLLNQHVGDHLDLLAEELRMAQVSLGELTGEFSADDLLGEIFSRFCIGK
jgi:tRNA modification GTPase